MSDISIGLGDAADRGRVALDSGNLVEAVRLFREAILDDPGDATLRADLGVALECQRDLDGASQAYAAAAALEPDNPIYHFNLGTIAQQQGRKHEAAGHYVDALEREPMFAEAYYNLGSLFFEAGLMDIAAQHYANALQARPDYPEAASNLGLTLRRLGRMEEAVEQFRVALNARPELVHTHTNLGLTLAEMGRHDEAIACFGQALTLDPRNPGVYVNIALAWRGAGRPEMAADAALHALKLAAGEVAAEVELSIVAAIYRRQGDEAALAKLLADWRAITGVTPVLEHTLAAVGAAPAPAQASDAWVASRFDALAKRYDETAGILTYSLPARVGEALTHHLGPAAGTLEVLDGGCGTGLVAPYLREYAKSLSGVDLSLSMLQLALRRGLYDALDQASLGAYLIALPDAFDLIVLAETLPYSGDLADLSRQLATSTRAGGWLFASIEVAPAGTDFVLRESGRYAHGEAYVRTSLQAAGFTLVEVSSYPQQYEGGVTVAAALIVARRA